MTTSNYGGVPGQATPTKDNGLNTRLPARESRRAEDQKSRSAFSKLIERFAMHGIDLRRSIGKNRPVRFFVVRDGHLRELSNLQELTLMLWAIGGLHA